MTKKEINSQIDYITIAKAIGIIMVVCGHIGGIYKIIGIPVFNSKPSEIFPIYSYHMPLFIFISGYFYKQGYIYDIKGLIKKRLKTLVIPYYKWNLFYGLLVTVLINVGLFNNGNKINLYNYFLEPIFQGYQYNLNGPSWFLISLFFIQIGYTLIRKRLNNNILDVKLSLLLFIITIIVNIWSNNIVMENHPIPLFLSRTLFGVLFFHIGYCFNIYFKSKNNLCVPDLLFIVFKLTPVFSEKAFFVIYIGCDLLNISASSNTMFNIAKNYTLSMSTMLLRGMSIVPILSAILGIIYILYISKLIEKILLNRDLKYLKMFFGFISKNTFAIMMHHMTINMFIQLILDSMDKNNIVYIIWYYSEDVVKPVICILFSVLFNKYVGSFLDEIYLRGKQIKGKQKCTLKRLIAQCMGGAI